MVDPHSPMVGKYMLHRKFSHYNFRTLYLVAILTVSWYLNQFVTFFSEKNQSIILEYLASNMTTHILQQLNLTNFEPHIFFDKCKILKMLSI